MTQGQTLWDRLDQLPDEDLAVLVTVTESILSGLSENPERVQDLPPSRLVKELQDELMAEGAPIAKTAAQRVVGKPLSRELVVPVLRAISAQPMLADEIEQGYHARKRMMVIDPATIGAAALLLLVLKLRRIRIQRKQVDIDFYQVTGEVLERLRELMGK